MSIIRQRALLELTNLSYTTIYRMMKRGEFPRRVQIGSRAVGWHRHEVDEWLQQRTRV